MGIALYAPFTLSLKVVVIPRVQLGSHHVTHYVTHYATEVSVNGSYGLSQIARLEASQDYL